MVSRIRSKWRYDVIYSMGLLRFKPFRDQLNENAMITVEGHCDERGTGEYNLALGEKRAETATKYLESMGINPGRIKTISFGLFLIVVIAGSKTGFSADLGRQ